jgi:type II secretory pathway pseudopilin PulG
MVVFRRCKRHGLTMIQVMVVLAILALLLGILLPLIARLRSAAAGAQSQNNLRQLVLAMHNFNDANRQLPPAVGPFPANSANKGTIFFYLLPYIEQDNLYQKAAGNVWNNGVAGTPLPLLLNPKDKSAPPDNRYLGWLATTNYAANWMAFKDGGSSLPMTFQDGTSNTFAFTERYQMCQGHPCGWAYASLYYWAPIFAYYSQGRFQSAPSDDNCDPALAQSIDPAGINVAMADGSSRLISNAISPQTWWLACDPNDGMPLGADF